MSGYLEDGSFSVARQTLDALWLRQKVISGNLANVDTPGYKSRSVVFEDMFKKALDRYAAGGEGLQSHLDSLVPKIVQNNSTQMREDGNNVDVDAENIELARVEIQYEFSVRALSSHIARMKYVINEGRG